MVVAVMEDSAVERKENFQGLILLTQQSLDLRVITISQSLGEVTIIDNDGTYMSLLLCAPTYYYQFSAVADIGFLSPEYPVRESDGSVVFFIQNQNPDLEREVVVHFTTTTGGTATG